MNNWISVIDELPENNKKVIATYKNQMGKQRTIIASFIRKWTELAEDHFCDDLDLDDCGEYSEEKDNYFVPEGWYEQLDNWDTYASLPVDEGDVTHWMPLPEKPVDDLRRKDA